MSIRLNDRDFLALGSFVFEQRFFVICRRLIIISPRSAAIWSFIRYTEKMPAYDIGGGPTQPFGSWALPVSGRGGHLIVITSPETVIWFFKRPFSHRENRGLDDRNYTRLTSARNGQLNACATPLWETRPNGILGATRNPFCILVMHLTLLLLRIWMYLNWMRKLRNWDK